MCLTFLEPHFLEDHLEHGFSMEHVIVFPHVEHPPDRRRTGVMLAANFPIGRTPDLQVAWRDALEQVDVPFFWFSFEATTHPLVFVISY